MCLHTWKNCAESWQNLSIPNKCFSLCVALGSDEPAFPPQSSPFFLPSLSGNRASWHAHALALEGTSRVKFRFPAACNSRTSSLRLRVHSGPGLCRSSLMTFPDSHCCKYGFEAQAAGVGFLEALPSQLWLTWSWAWLWFPLRDNSASVEVIWRHRCFSRESEMCVALQQTARRQSAGTYKGSSVVVLLAFHCNKAFWIQCVYWVSLQIK